MLENKYCNICGAPDWHSLDYLRDHEYWYQKEKREEDEPVGFKICKNCGYITYDYIEEDRLSLMYEAERPVMTAQNCVTANRKNGYHKAFFDRSDRFLELASTPGANFIDIGSAQGAMLNMLHEDYGIPKENLYGIEVNKAFVAFGRNEYCLNISDRAPDGVKFDFISYYHVLEHIQYPEKTLAQAVDMLKDDGIMYISVPYWLDSLQCFDGSLATDFEHIYHLNHVNVFTLQSFKNLLNNWGLEIIQEDAAIYAYTVFVKKSQQKPIVKEDWQKAVERLELEKQACELARANKPDEAVKLIPDYPDAYLLWSLNKDNMKSFDIQYKILTDAIKVSKDTFKLKSQLAKLLFQWDEQNPNKLPYMSNNLKHSEKIFREMLVMKPDNEESLYFLALIEGKHKHNYNLACELLDKCAKINPNRWAELMNMKAWFRKEQGINL